MNRTMLLALLLAGALSFLGHVAVAETLLPEPGTDLLAELARLSTACGLTLPSASLPYSRANLAVEFGSLCAAGGPAEVTQQARAYALEFRDQDTSLVGVTLSLSYEKYFRPADRALSTEDFAELVEVVDPMSLLRLTYQVDNSTTLAIAVAARREYNRTPVESNFFPSVAGNPVAIENNNLTEGFLQSSWGPVELCFGRQLVHVGPSPADSLLLSRRLPFLDALNVKGHFGPLTMTLIVSTLENRRATPDVAPGSADYDFGRTVILSNLHYFEYTLGFLRFGMGGQYLAVRPQNAFHIAEFFPVISWHQTNFVPNNLSLVADFSLVPFPGLTLYGQGGFDDINLSFGAVKDSVVPTIPAVLLGAQWNQQLERFHLAAWMEGGYTHYLWGSFDDEAAMARAIYRMDIDGVRRSIPLTSPYGPGTIWGEASFTVSTPWRLDGCLAVRHLARNPRANLTDTPYGSSAAVASAHLSQWTRVAFELRWLPLPLASISATPELNLRDGEAWFALTVGGGISLGCTSPIGAGRRALRATR